MTEFRDAERKSAKPLVGLYAESGAGKTYSALLLARGFVGPHGSVGMIETESGRGEAYADKTEYPEIGGYRVLSLRDDFSPRTYGAAIKRAEVAKLDALIIDSGSHEWDGPGGVLAMAAANDSAGKKGVLVWQQPKIEHKREFMLRLMQTPIPLVILCLRAKYPMEQSVQKGKNEWVRSTKLEPIQSDDILFEMFVHGWIDQGHAFHLTKTTSRTLGGVFENGKPLTVETGRELRAWADGADACLSETARDAAEGDGGYERERSSGISGTAMKLIELEGREAAEGPQSAVEAWAERVKSGEQWKQMSTEQRRQLGVLKAELLAKAALQ